MANNLPVRKGPDSAREAETLRKLKRYLLLREEHVLFHAACKQAGVSAETVKKYRRENPQFAEAEAVAISAGVENAEAVLQRKALDGDYQSLKAYLEANDEKYAPKRADERHSVLIVPVNAGNLMDRIANLREELQRRANDMPGIFRETNPFVDHADAHETIIETDIVDAEVVE